MGIYNLMIDSLVLQKICDTQLTQEYIYTNRKTLFTGEEICHFGNIDSDILNILNKEIDKIINFTKVLELLHKYNIQKYYDELIKYLVNKIINVENEWIELCVTLYDDIIYDIIKYNKKYKIAIMYLLNKQDKDYKPDVNDFLHNIKIVDYMCKLYDTQIYLDEKKFVRDADLDLIKYISKNSKFVWNPKRMLKYAAKYNNFEMAKWIKSNSYIDPTYNITEYATINGNFEMLKWARNNGFPWDRMVTAYAAENGHFEMLKWIIENGCPWDTHACTRAAGNGHFEIIKWAKENGCQINSFTCASAAENGHFEILKWLKENNCKWDYYTCASAAKNGHFEILKWAKENGCEMSACVYKYAKINNNQEILKWVIENGCPKSNDDAI